MNKLQRILCMVLTAVMLLLFVVVVLNVLNIFNSNWGVSKSMNASLNDGRILKYDGTDAEGYPVFSTPTAVNGNTKTWAPIHSLGQCWYASVGIKYMFN